MEGYFELNMTTSYYIFLQLLYSSVFCWFAYFSCVFMFSSFSFSLAFLGYHLTSFVWTCFITIFFVTFFCIFHFGFSLLLWYIQFLCYSLGSIISLLTCLLALILFCICSFHHIFVYWCGHCWLFCFLLSYISVYILNFLLITFLIIK